MSNFKGWTSENFEAAQKQILSKRLDAQMALKANLLVAEKAASKFNDAVDLSKSKDVILQTCKPKRTKTTKQKGESANSITTNVVRCINMQPKCVAYRINNVGIWDEKKQIHRRANTQKGIFDVSAIIKGRAAWFEIKAGYDKPSQDQLIFQQEVIRAGGIAEFVRSTDEFQKLFTIILLDL